MGTQENPPWPELGLLSPERQGTAGPMEKANKVMGETRTELLLDDWKGSWNLREVNSGLAERQVCISGRCLGLLPVVLTELHKWGDLQRRVADG